MITKRKTRITLLRSKNSHEYCEHRPLFYAANSYSGHKTLKVFNLRKPAFEPGHRADAQLQTRPFWRGLVGEFRM